MSNGVFKDGTPDVGVAGLARLLTRNANMTKLEAGQTWSNGKTARRIAYAGTFAGEPAFWYRIGASPKLRSIYAPGFKRWIKRTNATLQEKKP